MGEVYKHPPLVEALCEFQFDESTPWDVTVFGTYYDRVQAEFPTKRQMPRVEMSLSQDQGAIQGEMRETRVRMQFLRPDGSAMVQLAPHLLIVNNLPPYESWQAFKSLILDRLADYGEVVSSTHLRQIGLRYINRFDSPAQGFSVGNAFGNSEFLPARLRQASAPFFLRLEMPQGQQGHLLVTMGTIDSEEPDQVSTLLDLDFRIRIGAALDQCELANHLDSAHDRIEEVFESYLTDELRDRFNKEA